MKKVLLHCCCAPCSVSCINPLKEEGIEVTAFWYNPNIHPFKEYEARRDCMVEYAKKQQIALIVEENYGLKEFVRAVSEDISHRCTYCYEHRILKTARMAKEKGFDAFSTTLLASVYQNHDLIKAYAERVAKELGIEFLYRDFRPNFRDGNNKAREEGLYMQKYCGCVFSEEDRYQKQIKRDIEKFKEN